MADPAIEVDADGTPVRITSPDRVVFPELALTKGDIARYALRVGPGLLAALLGRPTTMERWPKGVGPQSTGLVSRENPEGDAFYQKKVPAGVPDFVDVAQVRFPSGRTAPAITPRNLATVLWMINLGTLRFHPWPVSAPQTDLVDQLRLDLDPQPGTAFAEAVVAALALREVLAEAGLTAFVKTSGGRGLHVYVPVLPVSFVDARHAVIALGRELARRMPERVTLAWWKEQRGERIFIDFNQMARDRLMASAYSIRPVPTATISTPLDWAELETIEPARLTLPVVAERFAASGDRWAGLYAAPPCDLGTALAWYRRDADAGEPELPYPPEHPKMPGEPPRVQPSRARERPAKSEE